MPLPLPSVDNRTWLELVADARAVLPRYAPAWTDYNVHDPGVTLVELFAWLSELLIFRADRISPAQSRSFLRWFGVFPGAATPAATAIALELPPSSAPLTLASGLKVTDPTSDLVFQADNAVRVSPAWIELDGTEGTHRGLIWSYAAGAFTDLTDRNCRLRQDMPAFGLAPEVGDALWLGFDCLPANPGEMISLHVWTTSWETDRAERTRLVEDDAEQCLCPPPAPSWLTRDECAEAQTVPPHPVPNPPPGWPLHYSARVQWEAWDGAAWQPLEVVVDETRALTLTGFVRLKMGTHQSGPPDAPKPAYWWVRSRLIGGGYECPPRLAGVAINCVEAIHSATVVGPEKLGTSRGHAEQVYRLQGKVVEQGSRATPQPLVAGSLRLRLTNGGPPDDSWTETSDWDRSSPHDKHYVADESDNSIHFGNGRVGRVPDADLTVEALEYRVGGGPAGNLAANRLKVILSSGGPRLDVRQPIAATGGAPAETLDQAHGRALQRLSRPSRGVTTSDWETLALGVPGVPVGRAKAIAQFHPLLSCWTAPGVVTIVVVPSCGTPPVPGPDYLAAVRRYLERRRPLTTELHVVGPNYVNVTVSASLHVVAGSGGVAAEGQGALDSFLDPLHGGPDGNGWPFGRGVLENDVMALLAKLPGVLYVEGLGISADGGPAQCGNLGLCPTDLVVSKVHRLTVLED